MIDRGKQQVTLGRQSWPAIRQAGRVDLPMAGRPAGGERRMKGGRNLNFEQAP